MELCKMALKKFSSGTILIKPDKIAAPINLKEKLLGQGEKIK